MCNTFRNVIILHVEIYLSFFVFIQSATGSNESCIILNATQDTQYIYSHDGYGVGENYPSNTDKCWLIHANPAIFTDEVRTQLIIEHLSIENTPGCLLDYLDIYAENISDSQLVHRHCGGNRNTISYILKSYYTYLHFVSDTSKEEMGFKINYKAVRQVNDTYRPVLVNGCEYLEATTEEQAFHSHYSYGDSNYMNNYEACWIIHVTAVAQSDVPPGIRHVVNIFPASFSLEPDLNCSLDYLAVYNGISPGSSFLGKYCGEDSFVATTTGNYMYIQFVTDKSKTFSGFSIQYSVAAIDTENKTISERCTYLWATHEVKYFTSHPQYGYQMYRSNYFACWIIIVGTDKPDDVVHVTKKDFNVENNFYDKITLYNGTDSDGDKLGEYSGSDFRHTTSSGRYMYIIFLTDASVEKEGFNLSYYASDIFGIDNEDETRSQFPKWAIVLIVLGIVLVITGVIGVIARDRIKEFWNERTYCRYKCECDVREWCKQKSEETVNDENTTPVTTNQIILTETGAMNFEATENRNIANSRSPSGQTYHIESGDVNPSHTQRQKRNKKHTAYESKDRDVSSDNEEAGANLDKDSEDNNDHTNPRWDLPRWDHASHSGYRVGRSGVSYTINEDIDILPPPYDSEIDVPPPPYPSSENECYI